MDRQKLTEVCSEIFKAAGLQEQHAACVADNLVEAELRGVRSHGVIQVKTYVERLNKGKINKTPHIRVLKETQGTLLVDGDFSPGAVSGTFAMDRCIEKAKETGIASAAVRNGTHFGMAAYYAMRALPFDMMGFAFCNAQPRVAVHGSVDRNMGTNPICAAIPANREHPIVFDAATSAAAYNKVFYASKEGYKIEGGLALDDDGVETRNPQIALEGVFLPFGGYKGSGLAVIVNVLCTLLTGGAVSSWPVSGADSELREDLMNVGFYFSALDISAFQEPELFKRSMDAMIRRMKSSRKKKDCGEIYMPGEIEFLQHARQSRDGVSLGRSVFSDLSALRLELNLSPLEDILAKQAGQA